MTISRAAGHAFRTKRRRTRSLKLEPLENRSLLATATLETLFGEEGVVRTSVPVQSGSYDIPLQVIQQTDEKLLVIGQSMVPAFSAPMIARLMPDGSRDTSFGSDGVALLKALPSGLVSGATVLNNGKIIVCGFAERPFLARLNSDGSPDTNFGNAGYLDWRTGELLKHVVALPDGSILVGASAATEFSISRLSPNGNLDSSYGVNGIHRSNVFGFSGPFEMSLQPDGGVVVAAKLSIAGEDFVAVTRITTDGVTDSSFADGGVQRVKIGSQDPARTEVDLELGSDGTIAVAATNLDTETGHTRAAIVVLSENGQPRNDFSGDGLLQVSLGIRVFPYVDVLADGSILLGGAYDSAPGASHHFLSKISAEGEFDVSWGSAGYAVSNFSSRFRNFADLLVTDEAIFTLVSTNSSSGVADIGVTKWLPGGVLDPAFHSAGVSTIDGDASVSFTTVEQLLPQPGGGMMLLGMSGSFGTDAFTAVSYKADGQLNESFGDSGVGRFPRGVLTATGTLQRDGKIVVATTAAQGANWAIRLTRYLSDGSIDPSFSFASRPPGLESVHPQHIIEQADGKLVVFSLAVNQSVPTTVERYLPDGRIDENFGVGGAMQLSGSLGLVHGVVELEGSLYVLTGRLNNPLVALLKIGQDGQLDFNFGGDGDVVVDNQYSGYVRLVLDHQQKLVVVTPNAVRRYLLNGAPDSTFSGDGLTVLPGKLDEMPMLRGAAVDSRGNLIVTRRFSKLDAPGLEVVRLKFDGSLDLEFSTQASEIVRAQNFVDFPALMVHGNEITVAGTSRNALDFDFELIRIRLSEHAAWQNPANRLNVDNDPGNHVVPMDALLIINALHRFGPHELSPEGPAAGELYLDVSGDGYLSAIDALMIINYLHANPVPITASTDEMSAAEAESGEEAIDALTLDAVLEQEASAAVALAENLDSIFWAFEDGKKRADR